MSYACAIYGYEFTKPFECQGMRFLPRHSWVTEAQAAARDLGQYNLTGIVLMDSYEAEQIFRLEAVLSFIEHLDVLIADPEKVVTEDYFARFPSVARRAKRNNGGGAVLHQDTFFPDMRSNFIELAMERLADDAFCTSTGWNTLFFKATVPFRQHNPYLDVSYFLLFSGLETYVRRTMMRPEDRDVAALVAKRLRQMGFDIYSYKASDLKRSADSYARLRNALFHNSSTQAIRRAKDGTTTAYELRDYYSHFVILVSLVVLKGIGFSHPRIHWDSWITMQH